MRQAAAAGSSAAGGVRRSGEVVGVTAAVVAALLAVPAAAAAKGGIDTKITSAPPTWTSSTSATLAFTSTVAGATFSCSLDGAAAAPCTSPAGYSSLAPGKHTFSVASSSGTLTDTSPAVASWTVDVAAPSAPTGLTATTPSSTSVALTWKAGTDNGLLKGNQVLRDGALLATVGAVTSYTDSTVTAGSTHTYTVRAVDAAGNVSVDSAPATVTTPAAAPAPDTLIDSGPLSATSATTATFAFHASVAGSTFTCSLDGSKATNCNSPRSYSGLREGSHAFQVTAKYGGVSDSTPATASWVVDLTAPMVPTGLSAVPSGPTSIALSWTASTDAGTGVAGYDVLRDGVLVATPATPGWTDTAAVTGTFYRYAVRARDAAGNTSALTSAVLARAVAPYDPHLTRAPYLTDLVGTHVAVGFATDRSATTGSVSYGAVAADGSCPLTGTAPAQRSSLTVGAVLEYQWTAEVDLPATGTYCYRPLLAGTDLLAGNPSPQVTTQEPAGSTKPFSFAVLGDWGQVDASSQNPDQSNVLAQLAASGVRFAVTTGDNGYPNGSQVNYGDLQQTGTATSAVFGPSMWTVPGATVPLFLAGGNHGKSGTQHADLTTFRQDRVVQTSGGRYQNDTYCCVNGTAPSDYASMWYAFTAGNTRFYVLDAAWGDTNTGTADPYANDAAAHFAPGTPEYEWLKNDLETHDSQLKMAFGHYPFYADSPTESSDTYLTGPAALEGLLGSHGVQLVFNGHAHLYQRNVPSAAGMPTTYVTGGGGATLEPIGPCSALDAYGLGWSPSKSTGTACGSAVAPTAAASVFHFLKVTVSGTSVTVAPTDSLGRTFDVQTYTYSVPPDTYLDQVPPAGTTSGSATLAFHASGSPATFSCAVDGQPATACSSPLTLTGLAEGSHTVSVAATVGGVTDPRPAVATWTVDSTPPGAATGLTATATSPFDVHLSWTAAPDNTGVVSYAVRRDGQLLGSSSTPSYDDQVLGGSTHSYDVTAYDVAGNASPASDLASVTSPPPPAPVFADGFESGNLSAWTTTGGLVVQSALAHHGSYAAEGATTTGATYAKRTLPATYADGYARVVLDVLSATDQVNALRLRDATGASLAYLYVDPDGRLGLRNDALSASTLSTQVLTPGWHALELRRSASTAAGTATGALQVWLDNVLVPELSSTAVDTGTAPTGGLQIGETQTGRTYDVVFDDAAFGTSRLGSDGDTTPPTAPVVDATAQDGFHVALTWSAATDDVALAGYDVLRDGVRVGTTTATSFVDGSVLAGTGYSYAVVARDTSDNTTSSAPVTVTTPAAAPAVFADGFESGDLSAWTSKAGLVVQASGARSGTYAAEGATTTGATYAKKTLPGSYDDGYARVAFRVASQSSIIGLLRLRNDTGGSVAALQLETSGRLSLRVDATATTTSSTVAPGAGWHVLELHVGVSSGTVETWLDGVLVPALSLSTTVGSAPLAGLQVGETTTGRSYDVLFDDAAFGTSRRGVS